MKCSKCDKMELFMYEIEGVYGLYCGECATKLVEETRGKIIEYKIRQY